jgi:methylisocitrate lyase
MDACVSASLRQLLFSKGVYAPGVYDALSATLAASESRFDALYLPGTAVEASHVGAPDIGMMTLTELVERARMITRVSDLPLICDGDTGFGSIFSIQRTVRELEAAGASAVQIEDQSNPKKCPAIPGARRVADRSESRDRIAIAVEARRSPEFLVIARCDADIVSTAEVIERCNLYREAGADVTLPLIELWGQRRLSSLPADEQMAVFEHLRAEIDGPIATVFTPPGYRADDLHAVGIEMVFAPTVLHAVTTMLLQLYRSLAGTGSDAAYFAEHPREPATTVELFRLLGLDGHLEMEERYRSSAAERVDA